MALLHPNRPNISQGLWCYEEAVSIATAPKGAVGWVLFFRGSWPGLGEQFWFAAPLFWEFVPCPVLISTLMILSLNREPETVLRVILRPEPSSSRFLFLLSW